MERSGSIPSGGIRPDDLIRLADHAGPFASVWLERSGQGGWGRQGDDTRTGDALGELTDAGAPAELVARVASALDAADPGAQGVAIVGVLDGPLVVEELPEPPRRELVQWAPVPALGAILERRQGDIPAIVVRADRAGADLVITRPGVGDDERSVEGEDYPITKSKPGGWSQRRFQQRAEDSWEQNAGAVAEEVRQLAATMFPDLVVLGGDERAVNLIQEALPVELQAVTRMITSGRAVDGSEERRDEDVARFVRSAVAEETVELIQAFQDHGGSRAQAANGAGDTVRALQQAQVDVLLVHDGVDSERTGWIADGPGMVALDATELEHLGGKDPVSGRLTDVAILAALRTGASVRVIPDAAAVQDGLGALLRWPER